MISYPCIKQIEESAKMTERTHRAEDRRVKRTKKILRDNLFKLLETRTADEITVKELTEAADVNRSTFYFYYKDINDMIRRIQAEIYEVFEAEVISPEADFNTVADFVSYITRFLVFCKTNEKICKFVIGNDPNNNLTNMIKQRLLECIPDSEKVFGPDNPKRYLTCFAVAGFWQTILSWMYDGMKIPPDEMAAFMTNVYFFGGRTVLTEK